MDKLALVTSCIRDIPDFPKAGIIFKDITPILSNPEALAACIELFAQRFAGAGIDVIAGIESRGFLFGTPLAHGLGLPFVPIRKPGKLPYQVVREEYSLEYGTDAIEMHTDAIAKGQRVLIIDDLLATGGTAKASINLVEKVGGVVAGVAFVIELGFLEGRAKLGDYTIHSLLTV